MSTREIVTLQIGHYSNFVGTHWWNLQESSFVYDPSVLASYPKEVNHDVLFREGKNLRGEITYTPRLVSLDLNFSLGSLKREGTLYDVPSEDNIRWVGDVTLHQSEAAKKNRFLEDLELEGEEEEKEYDENIPEIDSYSQAKERDDINQEEDEFQEQPGPSKSDVDVFGRPFYNLDNDVKVWSDYLRTALHPKSINLLTKHLHNNPDQPFNVYGLGQQAVASGDQRDVIEDRVRFFVEDCDSLQGFHILFDNYNAFGGVSASMLSYLSDEFSNKSRFTFALTPAKPPDKSAKDRSIRIINSALSLHHCAEASSLYVPLSLASSLWRNVGNSVKFPKLQYKNDLDYHTSAILAASLDTATMPYRQESQPARVYDITSSFSSHGRKVAALNSSLPYLLNADLSFVDSLISLGKEDPWVSLTPHVQCKTPPVFQSCVVRGVPQSLVKRRKLESTPHALLSCNTVDDVLRLYLIETYPSSYNAGCVLRDGVKVVSPFPHIFASDISTQGFIMNSARPPRCGVDHAPMMTSLQSSSDLYGYIDSLVGSVAGFNIAKHQHFLEAGLETDDFTEMIDELRDLAQCYSKDS